MSPSRSMHFPWFFCKIQHCPKTQGILENGLIVSINKPHNEFYPPKHMNMISK